MSNDKKHYIIEVCRHGWVERMDYRGTMEAIPTESHGWHVEQLVLNTVHVVLGAPHRQ